MTTAVLITTHADVDYSQPGAFIPSTRRVVQVSDDIFYVFFSQSAFDPQGFVYQKSIDAGVTWGDSVSVGSGNADEVQVDIYHDVARGLVHIFREVDSGTRGIFYRYLDLSNDALSSSVMVTSLSPQAIGGSGGITVAVSGRIYVGGKSALSPGVMYYSDDVGVTWTQAGAAFATETSDFCQMWPDRSTVDPNDCCAIYWNRAESLPNNTVLVKQYAAASGIITTNTISAGPVPGTAFGLMSSAQAPNGHIRVGVFDHAPNPDNLYTFDVYGATVVQKTNVLTATNPDNCVAMQVLSNDWTYAWYGRGSAFYYKLSQDQMATWGAEVPYSTQSGKITMILADPAPPGGGTVVAAVYQELANLYIEVPVPVIPTPPPPPPPATTSGVILVALYMEGVAVNSEELTLEQATPV